MNRSLTIIFLLLSGWYNVTAKTAYVPYYTSYIHIVDNGDTIYKANNSREIEIRDKNQSFSIRIEHEDLSNERIKSIKRAKALSGWYGFSSVLSGVSTALSQNTVQYMVNRNNQFTSSTLSAMYAGIANAGLRLDMETWFENMSEEEMTVTDMERGLTWYIQPGQTMALKLNNPEVLQLRISDIHNKHVRYANIAAGSSADKAEVKYEDNDCWIIVAYKRESDGSLTPLGGFEYIDKKDFNRKLMNYKDLQDFLKDKKDK